MAKKFPTPTPEVPAVSEQPYYLQRAHIKDFRSIRDAKVEFKSGLNIIIGANGSGKTNLVRCVSSGIEITNDKMIGSYASFIISGRQQVEISYEKPDKNEVALLNAAVNIPSQIPAPLRSQQKVKIKTQYGVGEGENLFQTLLSNYGNIFKDSFFVYQMVMIPHGLPVEYPMISGKSEFIISALGVENSNKEIKFPAFILGALSSLIMMDIAKNDSVEIDSLLVQKRLIEISDFFLQNLIPYLEKFSLITDVRLSKSLQLYYSSVQKQIIVRGASFDFKIGNDWLPFSALSSGTQRMFYIISEVSIPNGNVIRLNNIEQMVRMDMDKIILLEEPELGIHPHQLHLLLNFLREQAEKHQIIITTHSPQVLDMLKEDELDRITICELDEKKGTQFRKLKKTQIVDAKRYMHEVGFLSDYWRMGDLETSK